MTTKDQESPIAFDGWALMIGNAAHELESLAISLPGQTIRRCACAFGCSILHPLAVELALKFLAYLRSGTAPGGLDRETKEIIEVVDMRTRTASGSPPISDILKANRPIGFGEPAHRHRQAGRHAVRGHSRTQRG